MEQFNKTLKEFVEKLANKYPEQKQSIEKYYKIDENTGSKYLDHFFEHALKNGMDLSTKNEIIFSKGNTILKHIDFYQIWNGDKELDQTEMDSIWTYLHTLYIYAIQYKKDCDLKDLLKNIKKLSGNRDELDEESKVLADILDSLSGKFSKVKEGDDDKLEDSDEEDGPSLFSLPEELSSITGVIADIAKEVAEEIKPEDINISNPMEIIQDLASGNFDINNLDDSKSGVAKLVKTIKDKIESKLSSGSIDFEKLLGEAKNILGKLGGKKSSAGKMFSKMMKQQMDEMKDMPDDQKQMMQDAMNILLNGGAGMEAQAAQMKKTMELSQTRDRLRKQLEEKQKKKAEKEKTKVESLPVQKELSEAQKEKLIADLERDFMREEKKQQATNNKKPKKK